VNNNPPAFHPRLPAPSPWWQHAIQDDVIVFVRGDVSPWRAKQIRAAVDDLAARLEKLEKKDKEK
jgi:hypothetical protein